MALAPRRDGPPSVHHVAERAGVSLATVSNVLNHPERVAPATAQRVHEAIDALGYTPNRNARTLVAGTSRSIGVIVDSLRNSLFSDLVSGVHRAGRASGWTSVFATNDDDPSQRADNLAYLDGARVGGIVLAPMQDPTDQIAPVRRHGRPVVLANYDPPAGDSCAVVVDNEQAGYLAATHLIELGCRRIAFVSAREEYQPVQRRRAGITRAIAERPDVALVDVDAGAIDPPGGTDAGARIAAMPDGERPDGVIGVTDLLAMAVVTELRAAGFRVPEDVRVMGCDHNSEAWGGAVPLTSVTMHGEDMGREAVALLLAEVAEDPETHVHRTIVLPSELLPRESTVGRGGGAGGEAVPTDPRRTEA